MSAPTTDPFYPIDIDTYTGFIRGELVVRCQNHPGEADTCLMGFDEVGMFAPSCGCGLRHAVYGMSEPESAGADQ